MTTLSLGLYIAKFLKSNFAFLHGSKVELSTHPVHIKCALMQCTVCNVYLFVFHFNFLHIDML